MFEMGAFSRNVLTDANDVQLIKNNLGCHCYERFVADSSYEYLKLEQVGYLEFTSLIFQYE